MKEKPVRARKGFCNHYTGVSGPGMKEQTHCAAGVSYRELSESVGAQFVNLRRLPCVPHEKPEDVVSCAKCEMPTDEQIAAHRAYLDERIKLIGRAMTLCREHAKKNNTARGDVECPGCGKRLFYSIARSNNHMHGQCQTKDCVGWMQ